MVKPQLARRPDPTKTPDAEADADDAGPYRAPTPRARYAERRVAPVQLVRRARTEGAARLQRAATADDDEREITSGL